MASSSTSTARSATELSHLGGIEALKLKAGPVRRNLFGPVDHQQLEKDFQRLLCMNAEVAKQRWNFDFQSETPGDGGDGGDVAWEALGLQDVPAFYRGCTVRQAPRRTAKSWSSSSGECSSGYNSSSGSGDEYLELTTRGCYSIQRQGKRKQASITDFFKVKKRTRLHYKATSRQ